MKTKQQTKWAEEIKQLEMSIPEMEGYLNEHRDKLLNDTTIDFYEIQRRNEAGKTLINNIAKAKKRLAELKEKV